MKNIEDYIESGELEMTPEQIKAAKSVYKAMREAAKLNVQFWDDYGTLACYNGNKLKGFQMHSVSDSFVSTDYDPQYSEMLKNFQAGNADDPRYWEPK